MSTADDFAQATKFHQAGNLPEAEKFYRQVLEADPRHAEAWHMMGVLAHQVNRLDVALHCLENAIKLAPQVPAFWHNQALMQASAGKSSEALASMEQLLRLEPRNPDSHRRLVQILSAQGPSPRLALALKNLGNVLADDDQYAEAIACYRQALELHPHDAGILNNMGVASMESGNLEGAVTCYQQAITLRPQIAELHNNLGNALLELGRTEAAIAAYRRALEIKPNYPKASNNLAVMLIEEGQFEAALEVLREALRLRPDLSDLHSNVGVALKNLGRNDEAMNSYRQAIKIEPTFADAHHNIGNLLLDASLLDNAVLAYQEVLKHRPDDVDALSHLALVEKRQNNMAGAAASLQRVLAVAPNQPLVELRAAATLCPVVFAGRAELNAERTRMLAVAADFTQRNIRVAPLDLVQSYAEFPFNAQFFDGDLRELRTAYAGIFAHLWNEPPPAAGTGQPRIGFVVTKGHEGVFLKSMRGVLARLDRQRFAIVVIAPVASAAKIKQAIENEHTVFVPLPDRSDHALQAIRDANLDVLYHWEVGTDSHNYFLPLFRLAPVQCTSWGTQMTSGMGAMDAYLSSALVEPPDAAGHYSEKLLLAETLLTYQIRPTLPETPKTREDFGLAAAQHVYTCAQHLGKFHPDFDPLIAGILRGDPQGVMVITEDRYRFAAEQLKQRFAKTLGDVANRVHWLPRLPTDDYRSLIAASDVLLDPPHFGGVNSTYDGLALGKPIVTLPSGFQRGRYTLGCYRKMNVMDCIVADAAAYVKLAVRLGTERDFRAAVSKKISAASGVLFEDQAAVKEHERLLELLVEQARRKEK